MSATVTRIWTRRRTVAALLTAVMSLCLILTVNIGVRTMRIWNYRAQTGARILLRSPLEGVSAPHQQSLMAHVLRTDYRLRTTIPGAYPVQAIEVDGKSRNPAEALRRAIEFPELERMYLCQISMKKPVGDSTYLRPRWLILEEIADHRDVPRWIASDAKLSRVCIIKQTAAETFDLLANLPARDRVEEVTVWPTGGPLDLSCLAEFRSLRRLQLIATDAQSKSLSTLRRLPLLDLDPGHQRSRQEWIEAAHNHPTLKVFADRPVSLLRR